MRTIKASEVRKGMRVRVEQRFTHPPLIKGGAEDETIETIEGTVTVSANANITFANGDTRYLRCDYPVTVLAEPEPEWVEGAWYWTQTKHGSGPTLRMRGDGLWRAAGQTTNEYHLTDRYDLTVFGRVLIVDWPGDDVARDIELDYTPGGNWIATENTAAQIIADAIRTQGGVR